MSVLNRKTGYFNRVRRALSKLANIIDPDETIVPEESFYDDVAKNLERIADNYSGGGGGSGMPPVTSENNGATVEVVDGKWEVVGGTIYPEPPERIQVISPISVDVEVNGFNVTNTPTITSLPEWNDFTPYQRMMTIVTIKGVPCDIYFDPDTQQGVYIFSLEERTAEGDLIVYQLKYNILQDNWNLCVYEENGGELTLISETGIVVEAYYQENIIYPETNINYIDIDGSYYDTPFIGLSDKIDYLKNNVGYDIEENFEVIIDGNIVTDVKETDGGLYYIYPSGSMDNPQDYPSQYLYYFDVYQSYLDVSMYDETEGAVLPVEKLSISFEIKTVTKTKEIVKLLPDVTNEDNGKSLTVENGEWCVSGPTILHCDSSGYTIETIGQVKDLILSGKPPLAVILMDDYTPERAMVAQIFTFETINYYLGTPDNEHSQRISITGTNRNSHLQSETDPQTGYLILDAPFRFWYD